MSGSLRSQLVTRAREAVLLFIFVRILKPTSGDGFVAPSPGPRSIRLTAPPSSSAFAGGSDASKVKDFKKPIKEG
jgi:hypothetical protein